jgi:hypothetical protein
VKIWFILAACGGAHGAAIVNNGGSSGASCPVLGEGPSFGLEGKDCTRGEPLAIVDAPATAPACHAQRRFSAQAGIEQVVVAGVGRVVLEQYGCEDWSLSIRFGGAPTYAHAAAVVRALPASDGQRAHLATIADRLDAAAKAGAAPGTALEITPQYDWIQMKVVGGVVEVDDDIAL